MLVYLGRLFSYLTLLNLYEIHQFSHYVYEIPSI